MADVVEKPPRKPRKETVVRNRHQQYRDIRVTKIADIPTCAVCRNYPARRKGTIWLCGVHYGQ